MPTRLLYNRKQRKVLDRLANVLPEPKGFLKDVLEAERSGELSRDETSSWILQFALGVQSDEDLRRMTVSANSNGTNRDVRVTRQKRERREDPLLHAIYSWLTRFRGVRPDTATQYVARLADLKKSGYDVREPQTLLACINDNPKDFRNVEQTKRVLRLMEEFQGSSSEEVPHN